jgi:transcriptional antiterminator RfaH
VRSFLSLLEGGAPAPSRQQDVMPAWRGPFKNDIIFCNRVTRPEQGKNVNLNMNMEGKQWYAVRLRPRSEKMVALHLRDKGYEEYLPLYRSRRRWSDRMKEVDLPLFPGYIFCKFDVTNRLPILVTPGVLSITGCGKVPLPIPELEISAVQRIVTSNMPYGPWPTMRVGQAVRVRSGPLEGLEGLILELRNKYHLVISVALLSRSVSVLIDSCDVAPIGDQRLKTAV